MRILKKSLALLLALAMMASLVVVNVVADEAVPTVTAVASAEQVIGGSTFTVDIDMSNNPGIVGMKLYCVYDTDAFELTAIDVKNVLAGNNTKALGMQTPGNTTLYWIDDAAMENNTANGTLATLSFSVKPAATLGEKTIDLQVDAANIVNFDTAQVAFTAVDDTITVTEEQWIASTGVVELGDIKYGADAPALPATVKGIGKTSGGTAINAADEPGVVLNVEWGTINTLVAPADGLSVAGTVTTTESDLLKYKNADGEPIAAPAASATYDIVKTDAGVVAPVEIEIKKKSDGSAIGLEAIKVLEEVVAVANTTIAIEGGETETVTLNWAGATLYDDGDATLDTSLDAEESIQLNVPVTGDTTYYDLTSKVAVATLTMVPAEIEDAAVTIEGATTADDYVKVKASLPVEALTAIPVTAIHGAGYKAESAAAKAAIEAMKLAMGRAAGDVETSDVDIKTMYVGLNNLEESAVYSIKVFKADGTEVDLSNTSMEYTAVKDEVVFYWTFNQESPNAATEDVVDGGVYTIKAYKGDEEIDSIDVTVGEDDVLGDAPVVYDGTFTLAVDEGSAVKEIHDNANDIVLSAEIQPVVKDGVATATIELVSDKKLKNILSDDSVDSEFTVSVYYNNAALVVGTTEGGANILGVTGKIMAVGDNTTVGGIGIPTTPAKPMTPVTPDEPGTEEPGTEEPGTEEPGTDAPAIDIPIEGAPFGDITEEYRWAVDSIATLKDLGVINGNENGDFVPAGEITRAEFTKMMVVLLGLEITEEAPAFADCAADAWFAPYIAAAAKAGIINGVSETEFAPDATITREQACAILGRALGLADAEVEATFTDAGEISDYAESFVAALAKLGIINGYEDGSFAPANNITRAEAAKILAGALGVIAPTDAPAAE